MDDSALAERIADGMTQLGIAASALLVRRFVDYLRLIERWNATYNLTAIRKPEEMVTHHLLDCLAAATALIRERGQGLGERLLDVGTGAGLPGLVIAALCPERQVVCLDSIGKKIAFVTQAAALLGLKNVSAVQGRVESINLPACGAIVSRAFASLSDFVRGSERLLRQDGVWLAMKAKVSDEELRGLHGVSFHVERLQVPNLNAERCLVWITRKVSTRIQVGGASP